MKRPFLSLVAVVALASLALAPSVPSKAAEPSKPGVSVAAAPAAAPAKKVDYPQKGKLITMIEPHAAGGATDRAARVLAPLVEKELGSSVQIVNRPGAATQVGTAALAASKPDGYTVGYVVLPNAITAYLDPERKATFTRKSFAPIAVHFGQPYLMAVLADSPYKTMKDLVEAAKAKPESIKVGTTGIMGVGHLTILGLEKTAGVKFAAVHFYGAGPEGVALLGGHIDVATLGVVEVLPYFKAGQVRILGIADKRESSYLPGAKTMESQGHKVYFSTVAGIVAPAGTPREIVDVVSAAIKRAMETGEHKKRMEEMACPATYMDPDEFAATWAEAEEQLRPLMEAAKQK